jgi:hypothetical protein
MAGMSTFQNTVGLYAFIWAKNQIFLREITPELVGLEKNFKVQKLLEIV